MEPCGIQVILAIKSHQIQWNLMGNMGFWQSNLTNFNGTIWDPWDFSNQIISNPLEPCGIQVILAIKFHQTQWNLMGEKQ